MTVLSTKFFQVPCMTLAFLGSITTYAMTEETQDASAGAARAAAAAPVAAMSPEERASLTARMADLETQKANCMQKAELLGRSMEKVSQQLQEIADTSSPAFQTLVAEIQDLGTRSYDAEDMSRKCGMELVAVKKQLGLL